MTTKFINITGGIMYVDDSRVEEYKEAGYKLASNSVKEANTTADEMPVKRTTARKKRE